MLLLHALLFLARPQRNDKISRSVISLASGLRDPKKHGPEMLTILGVKKMYMYTIGMAIYGGNPAKTAASARGMPEHDQTRSCNRAHLLVFAAAGASVFPGLASQAVRPTS